MFNNEFDNTRYDFFLRTQCKTHENLNSDYETFDIIRVKCVALSLSLSLTINL